MSQHCITKPQLKKGIRGNKFKNLYSRKSKSRAALYDSREGKIHIDRISDQLFNF